jgi:hypothetical protein
MLSFFSAIKLFSLSALFHLALAAQPRWDSLHRHCQGQMAAMGAYGFHANTGSKVSITVPVSQLNCCWLCHT